MDPIPDWVTEFPAAVTVTGKDGTILYMNDKSARTFEKDGGRSLVGRDVLACHNENSKAIIRRIIDDEKPNVYTIEKKGVKKLIFQAPWYSSGELAGLVELSLEIPFELPHFNRD
ncbi:MAG TPA: hypothetical protein VMC79_11290 [Rectinemataceae bacterium]|nr:hypothetical protein [Rectinemataceae bacterium]